MSVCGCGVELPGSLEPHDYLQVAGPDSYRDAAIGRVVFGGTAANHKHKSIIAN